MSKTPRMRATLEKLSPILFGRQMKRGECVGCGSTDLKFRDEISEREYKISCLCQECQDEVFNLPEE
jgi:hypothetical protein